jgi:glutathione synthase
LREKGLIFVGLDVIGDYLTEINVTSPTCIRELDAQFDLNIAGDLIKHIEQRLNEKTN